MTRRPPPMSNATALTLLTLQQIYTDGDAMALDLLDKLGHRLGLAKLGND